MRTSIFSSETLGGTAGGRRRGSQLAFDGRQPKAERSGKSRERQAPRQAGCFRDLACLRCDAQTELHALSAGLRGPHVEAHARLRAEERGVPVLILDLTAYGGWRAKAPKTCAFVRWEENLNCLPGAEGAEKIFRFLLYKFA